MEVRVIYRGIERVEHGEFHRWMLRLGNRILNNSRTKVPVDTGLLRSTGAVWSSGNDVRVGYRTRYARMVHEGTRPHEIRPRTGSVLRFPGRGGIVYARVVHHPGTRGVPYLTEAMREEVR